MLARKQTAVHALRSSCHRVGVLRILVPAETISETRVCRPALRFQHTAAHSESHLARKCSSNPIGRSFSKSFPNWPDMATGCHGFYRAKIIKRSETWNNSQGGDGDKKERKKKKERTRQSETVSNICLLGNKSRAVRSMDRRFI